MLKIYLSEICHGDDLDRDLNYYANEGWRLVVVVYLDHGNYRYVMEADAEEQKQRKEQASAHV